MPRCINNVYLNRKQNICIHVMEKQYQPKNQCCGEHKNKTCIQQNDFEWLIESSLKGCIVSNDFLYRLSFVFFFRESAGRTDIHIVDWTYFNWTAMDRRTDGRTQFRLRSSSLAWTARFVTETVRKRRRAPFDRPLSRAVVLDLWYLIEMVFSKGVWVRRVTVGTYQVRSLQRPWQTDVLGKRKRNAKYRHNSKNNSKNNYDGFNEQQNRQQGVCISTDAILTMHTLVDN